MDSETINRRCRGAFAHIINPVGDPSAQSKLQHLFDIYGINVAEINFLPPKFAKEDKFNKLEKIYQELNANYEKIWGKFQALHDEHYVSLQKSQEDAIAADIEIKRLKKALKAAKVRQAQAEPEPDGDEGVSFTARAGDNSNRALSESEVFRRGIRLLGQTQGADRRASSFGLEFGRLARLQIVRFQTEVKPRNKLAKIKLRQADYLTAGFRCAIGTVNIWISALEIVERTDVKWSAVEEWCRSTNWDKRKYGAERIRQMAKDYAERQP